MNYFIVLIIAAAFAASFVGGSHVKNANVIPQRRMLGGTISKDRQFPYQISLQNLHSHFCSGSIINREWVLTAAHCLEDKSSQTVIVVAGTKQLSHEGQVFFVRKIIRHSSYSPKTSKNDIALIQVTEPFVYTDRIQSIELNKGDVPVGARLTFSGWGINSHAIRQHSDVLQYMNMVKISTEECKAKFSNAVVINKNHICAYKGIGQGPCEGDSGGPLIYNGRLSGILSWGIPCDIGGADLFTKVSAYIDWIKHHIH